MDSAALTHLAVEDVKTIRFKRDRVLYRFMEMLPGILIWSVFGLAIFLSWSKPIWVAFFIIAFDLYWLFKIVYFSIHTRSAYRRMKKYLKRDWLSEGEKLPSRNLSGSNDPKYKTLNTKCSDLWHLVILSVYKEPYEVLQPAVEALANSYWPKERMVVVLGIEESAGKEARQISQKLYELYRGRIPNLFVTLHPYGLAGEIPGKGSNERWAGLWAKENFVDKRNILYERIIVSSFDADTVASPHYFSCVAYHYLTCKNPLRSSFQPIPLFLNNIWQAPALSRVMAFSSTLWHTMNQERPEKHITFSSHSMPFQALVDSGFWQPNVVSEDSRIFWQCFLRYNGDYRVESLYYPVSMDANATPTLFRTLKNIYKQQRRWAYGAADIAYFLFGFLKKRKEIPKKLMWQYGFYTLEGFFSWATYAILIFALGWLPLLLGGEAFNATILAYNLPTVTRTILMIAMMGLMASVFLNFLLLPQRPAGEGRFRYVYMVLQWLLVPIILIVFGSFPAIEAQTRLMIGKRLGFWPTEKFRK